MRERAGAAEGDIAAHPGAAHPRSPGALMTRSPLRHPLLVTGVVVALGAASVAPAAAAAATPSPASAPSPAARGLFGDLLAPVGSLLDAITGGLVTGALPPAAVTTITDALDQLQPEQLAAVLDTLTPEQLAQVVTAGPGGLDTLLTGVLTTVTDLLHGLPSAGGGATAPPQLDAVLAQLTGLLAGVPGGDAASLETLTTLLNDLTKLLALPGVAELPALGPLLGELLQVRGEVPAGPVREAIDGVLVTITDTLGGIPVVPGLTSVGPNASSGTSRPAQATDVGVAPDPVQGAGAVKPATSAALATQARIRSVSVSKNRRSVRVRVTCPRGATASCRIIISAKLRGSKLKVVRRATVKVGATRTITAKVPARTVRSVRRSGGKLVVRVGTAGSGKAAVAKTVKVRRTAR